MAMSTVTGREIQVTTAFRLPVSQYQRLVKLAEDRGYVRGGTTNVSEAAREVMTKGLAALDGRGEGDCDQD
jgi:predicted DNA-binding protein